jgi:hypothetical protein
MHWGSRRWSCKIIPKAACDKHILAHFHCRQGGINAREYLPIATEGIPRGVAVSFFFKISIYSHRSIWKVYNCIKCLKAVKGPWKPSETDQNYLFWENHCPKVFSYIWCFLMGHCKVIFADFWFLPGASFSRRPLRAGEGRTPAAPTWSAPCPGTAPSHRAHAYHLPRVRAYHLCHVDAYNCLHRSAWHFHHSWAFRIQHWRVPSFHRCGRTDFRLHHSPAEIRPRIVISHHYGISLNKLPLL